MKRFIHLVAAIAVAVPSLVCAQQPQQQQAAPSAAAPGDEAARVGERVITIAEIDAAWRKSDPAGHAQAANALYDGRRQVLDRLVADLVIERAAQAKGVSVAQFTKDEIARRTAAVTDADVEAFYQQNAARMQGKRLDEMRSMIRTYLQQQREAAARSALVAELRKAGPAVRVALDPPRQKVDVASTDPSRGAANASVVLVEYSDYQ